MEGRAATMSNLHMAKHFHSLGNTEKAKEGRKEQTGSMNSTLQAYSGCDQATNGSSAPRAGCKEGETRRYG